MYLECSSTCGGGRQERVRECRDIRDLEKTTKLFCKGEPKEDRYV